MVREVGDRESDERRADADTPGRANTSTQAGRCRRLHLRAVCNPVLAPNTGQVCGCGHWPTVSGCRSLSGLFHSRSGRMGALAPLGSNSLDERRAVGDAIRSAALPRVDFEHLKVLTRSAIPSLVARWLPDGRRVGAEWVCRNPRREDKRPGSFKVNMRTGRWADFATGDAGGDLVSLAAYLFGLTQREAARRLSRMFGV